ncbi:hypothetical protein BDR03DRAFT_968239 [Suillus americanus]|nr:hypothetical protein BDR03DRAFT_968239 [Suillus americanus]
MRLSLLAVIAVLTTFTSVSATSAVSSTECIPDGYSCGNSTFCCYGCCSAYCGNDYTCYSL